MILLDSDHLSVLRYKDSALYAKLAARLASSPDQNLGVTVISLEEQMRGWLAEIARRRKTEDQVPAYERLLELVRFYSDWQVFLFDKPAAQIFDDLRRQRVRVASQDLKIASIALVNNATLISANLVDFERIPGLRVVDWLYG
jgi:tRNA(fMet)-specific endonuclease VapC